MVTKVICIDSDKQNLEKNKDVDKKIPNPVNILRLKTLIH